MRHLTTVNDLRNLLRESGILQRYPIRRLGVFGSFSRGEAANDVDLLIEDDIPLETALAFKEELEALMDNELDVMLERWANPIVLHRARKDLRHVT